MVAKVDSWLPRDHAEDVRAIARDIDAAMAGFIRGQGTRLPAARRLLCHGLIVGRAEIRPRHRARRGLLTFIPYVGAIVGGVLAIGVGARAVLARFRRHRCSIVGIFAVGQFIEGNFLSPKLVGQSVGLHPVWLMFALFAFGYIFGFVGLLLAVPLAAAAGVLVRFALAQYLASKLYLGVPRAMPNRRQDPRRAAARHEPARPSARLALPHRTLWAARIFWSPLQCRRRGDDRSLAGLAVARAVLLSAPPAAANRIWSKSGASARRHCKSRQWM